MGKLRNGFFGGFSGKVGNVVGARWKDIEYIRSLPSKVHDPKTDEQIKQRSRFSLIMDFQKTITQFIRVGFQAYANGRMTAFNAATSYNMKKGIKYGDKGVELDFPNILVSRGSLYSASVVNVKIVDDALQFSWDSTIKENAKSDDIVMLIVFNSKKNEAVYDINAGKRSSSTADIKLSYNWIDNPLETFIAFKNADGSIVSDSVYAGQYKIGG